MAFTSATDAIAEVATAGAIGMAKTRSSGCDGTQRPPGDLNPQLLDYKCAVCREKCFSYLQLAHVSAG